MSAAEPPQPHASGVLRFLGVGRDSYLLGLLRVALGALLFLNGGRLLLELQRGGFFGDFLHIPIWPEALVPSRAVYLALLSSQAVAALLVLAGPWSRWGLLFASSVGLFLLGCDRLQYHNNRYALLLLGFLLAFTPCDRSFRLAKPSTFTLPASERVAPTFARRLFQIQVSLVYLSSACGKLLDSDWREGQVLRLRFESVAPFWADRGHRLPAALELFLASPLLGSIAAKVAISTELFLAFGLWLPRARRLALWLGVLFHFSIEVSARVELFSWVMGASYLAFAVPELRQRRFEYDPERALGRALANGLYWLDWLARFEITGVPGSAAREAFFVVDHYGQAQHGLSRFASLTAAIPLLFPLWLPLALAAKAEHMLKH